MENPNPHRAMNKLHKLIAKILLSLISAAMLLENAHATENSRGSNIDIVDLYKFISKSKISSKDPEEKTAALEARRTNFQYKHATLNDQFTINIKASNLCVATFDADNETFDISCSFQKDLSNGYIIPVKEVTIKDRIYTGTNAYNAKARVREVIRDKYNLHVQTPANYRINNDLYLNIKNINSSNNQLQHDFGKIVAEVSFTLVEPYISTNYDSSGNQRPTIHMPLDLTTNSKNIVANLAKIKFTTPNKETIKSFSTKIDVFEGSFRNFVNIYFIPDD